MTYTMLPSGMIRTLDSNGREKLIPATPGNADFRAYSAWLAEGNVPQAGAAVVPVAVSRFQFRAALLGAGLLDAFALRMAHPSTSALARLAWEQAADVRRAAPAVVAAAAHGGLSEADLDAVVIAAAAIEV